MTTDPPEITDQELERRLMMTLHATDSERKMLLQYWATLDAGLFIVKEPA